MAFTLPMLVTLFVVNELKTRCDQEKREVSLQSNLHYSPPLFKNLPKDVSFVRVIDQCS